ncbi:acyl carrier protein [Buchnera aphidicola]|uniref:Acyl carrier protein n=1 Tax=Buchnera aphidicola subsp. Tuberolachnus salignus TaxID=98804 RepID=A0A170PBW8_BUCTT|nr:acyl carrier protein [Buchnera aphidicola]CUR53209.1 Acyl carrier protein [Buchnera aphidicola (Tuberolachnus salignus)]
MNNIQNCVKKIISKQFNYPIEKIKNNYIISEKFKADSLDMIELIMLIEEKFKIELNETNFNTLKTVQNIIDHIVKNVKK